MIFNIITQDFYIGSAITNNLYSRLMRHIKYFTGSKLISKAIKKYELSNFIYIILEYYPESINQDNYIELLKLEIKYISLLKPSYNFLDIAGSSYGYKHTIDTLIKTKENYSQDRISKLNKEKILSNEIKELMRIKALSRSDIIKNKYRKTNSKSIILLNKDKTIYKEYLNSVIFSKEFNCCRKTIKNKIINKELFRNKWYIIYKEYNI